jgi:hypothetical protein
MQGGQTQGVLGSNNIYPVDHVTSLLMDGKCINIINIWRKHNISAGDDLILVLKKIVPEKYNLSRQTNSSNWQVFGELPTNAVDCNGQTVNLNDRKKAGVWQLVPMVYSLATDPEFPGEYDYHENG